MVLRSPLCHLRACLNIPLSPPVMRSSLSPLDNRGGSPPTPQMPIPVKILVRLALWQIHSRYFLAASLSASLCISVKPVFLGSRIGVRTKCRRIRRSEAKDMPLGGFSTLKPDWFHTFWAITTEALVPVSSGIGTVYDDDLTAVGASIGEAHVIVVVFGSSSSNFDRQTDSPLRAVLSVLARSRLAAFRSSCSLVSNAVTNDRVTSPNS